MSKRLRLGAWVVALVAALAVVVGGIGVAFAAAGDVPAHDKILTVNNDGTYKLALNVKGDAEKDPQKVNIIVIVDRSNSMDTQSGTGAYVPSNQNGTNMYGLVDGEYVPLTRQGTQGNRTFWYQVDGEWVQYTGQRYQLDTTATRLQATKAAVDSLGSTLLGYNGQDGNPDDTVEMALVQFATTASTPVPSTTDATTFTNAVNGINTPGGNAGGTNWEMALRQADTISFGDSDPTYVIFFSDGAPTFYGTGPSGTGGETEPNMSDSYNASTDEAAALASKVGKDRFYTIFAYGSDAGRTYMTNLTAAAGAPASNNYSASNTAELEDAFAAILEAIEMAGIGDVAITDGTTNSVTTSSGPVNLLTVDTSSYKYYRAGGTDDSGNEKYDSNANEGLGVEWADAPTATFENSQVKWDLESVGVLENDVTYTVTFDCWPSQTTLDIVADIKNDPSSYDSLDPEIKKYIDRNGNLKTNTSASLSYDDTRTPDKEQPVDYINPDPVETAAVEQLAISKEWENELDSQSAEPITLTVTRDGDDHHTMTLSDDNDWTASTFISIGILRHASNGDQTDSAGQKFEVLETGHDFTFTEPEDLAYYWELEVPTIRPMLLDNVVTMLILKEGTYNNPDGATEYVIDGKTYYVGGTGTPNLTATNHRRARLNLTKVVEGSGADPEQTFPFTLNVVDSKASDGSADNLNSDYYVWFSVYNNGFVDAVVSGAQKEITTDPEKMIDDSGWTGYYYAPSGTDIVVNLKADDNLRFLNLPTDSTYTFTEGDLPNNYSFVSAELSGPEGSVFSVDGQTATGTIESTNTDYTVTYTNRCEFTEFEVTKVWNDNNNQDGLRPDPEDPDLTDDDEDTFDHKLALEPTPVPSGWEEYPVPDEVIEVDGNTYKYVWHNLPAYAGGQSITYVVREYEGDVPEGYTCDKMDQAVENKGTITNTHTPEKTETTVKKEWKDSDEDAETVRPKTITVELYKKVGEAAETLVKSYTLEPDADGNWTLTVTGLDKYENGTEIEYIWKEVESSLQGLYSLTKTVVDTDTKTTTFTNSRVTIDTKTDVVLNKTVEAKGTKWAPKTFEFTITAGTATYEDGTTGTSPAATKPNGTATFNEAGTQPIDFGKISFIKAGTYTYKVKEITTSGGGWTCDNTEYDVEVTVSVDNDGKLTAEVTKVAEITNKYEPTGSVELEATKAIEGAEWPEGKTITFTLAGEGGTLPENTEVTLTEEGTATFDAITYTEADIDQEYEYTITEDGFGDGWTADPEQITAKVKVEDNGDGTLKTTVTYDPADKTITNTYAAEGEETIEVTKALEGAAWPEGKTLTVTLKGEEGAPMPETTEVELTAAGKATFGPIAYNETHVGKTFTYTVTEDGFGDGWTGTPKEITAKVTVTDKGDGTLDTSVEYTPEDATFTNKYEAKGEAVLEATKAIEGADWPEGKTITFTLAGEGGTLPESTEVTLTEEGTATFDAIKYDESDIGKEYTYTITEDGFGDGWTPSPEQITATVKVTDKGDGTLDTEITYSPEDQTITNTYKAKGEVKLEAVKAIKGADWPEGKSITFTLAGEGGTLPENTEVTLTEEGTATFDAITYDESDIGETYTYTITEDGFGDGWTPSPEQITAEVTVTDKGDGTLETSVKYTPENKTITNTYKADGEAVLEATKAISGADWPEGKSITFTLAGEGGTLPETKTVTLTEEGTATFDAIKYTEADIDKEYTYTITEDGFGSGWTADPEQITAKVKVEDNGDGTLKTTITYTPENATITNKYAAEGEAILQATKTISGADWPEGKTLTFTLAGEGGTLPETTTQTLTSAGTVTFDAIKYDESDIGKEYQYTITEDGFGDGWTPSPEQITATVKVEDNGDGSLKTTVTYDPENKTINNKYEAEGEATLEVEKELVGREWKDGESFTFTLYGPDGAKIEDKEVTANGSVSFTKLTYDESDAGKTYKYTIKETTDPLPDGVTKSGDVEATVVVTDKGDGTLDTQVTYDPENKTIINTYEAKPVKAQIEVEKKVDGFIEGTDVNGNKLDRTFTITMTGPKIDGELSTKITTDGGTGKAVFPEIEYTFEDMVEDGKQVTTKDFEYTVKETVETPAGWTYDTNEYTVTVTVEDDQNGKLVVTNITKVDEEEEESPNVQIVNEYEEEGTEVTLHVIKNIDDQSDSAKDTAFKFQLIDSEGTTVDEKSVTTTDLKGEIDFDALEFTEAGTYNYTIIEKVESQEPGWTYDDHEYAVKIVVADDFSIAELVVTEKTVDGEAVSDDTINVTFTNVYKAEATKATLKVTKEVDDKSGSADPEKTFTFTLAGDKYMPKTTTATIKAGQTAEFGPIDYDKAGTFNYTITESDGGGAAWTYDTTSYPVTVKVVDENAKLVATVTYDGETTDVDGETILKVTNIYDPEDAKATPEARKLIKDLSKSAPDETFTFTLTPQGGAPGETQTVTRENGGPFSFDEITFDKVGTYNYTIQETAGSTNGFTYDTAEHALTITVTDPGDGQLKAEIKYADANEDGELVITNIYEAEPTSLVLDVEKVISGPVDPKEDATFTFELTGDAEMTTSVTGEGTASFDEIKYTEAGTYYYTVTEVPGDSDDYIYDGTVYTVTVEVVDEGGKLVATPTISANGADVDSIVFDNPYVPEVGLKVTKTVTSKPANGSYYKEGETVKYKIVVTNTGECDLTDVKVDDELTGDHWVVKKLAAGASKDFTTSYKVTKDDVKAGSVLNVVTAEADNPVDPDKPLKDKDKVKVPTGDDKTPPEPPHRKVVPQTGDDTPTGAMALMTVFGAAALTAGTVLKRKRK